MSNLQHLATFLFLIFLPVVISRQCYQYLSTHSFGDCDAKRIKVRCVSSQRCVTVSAISTSGVTDEGYARGCAATCSASNMPRCNRDFKCDVRCCSSDYCNDDLPYGPKTPPPHPTSWVSRKCYQCISTRSFEDRDAHVKTSSNSQFCVTVSAMSTSGVKVEDYARGCATSCSASDVPICNQPNVKCDMKCCSSDYCNDGLTYNPYTPDRYSPSRNVSPIPFPAL